MNIFRKNRAPLWIGAFWLITASCPTFADEPYVDQLIDPSQPEDPDFGTATPDQTRHRWPLLDQTVELLSQYRDDGSFYEDTLDYGVAYTAQLPTVNWGQLRLHVVAVDELNGADVPSGQQPAWLRPQSGVSRLSLEQYDWLLTPDIRMDNIIGTHRQFRTDPLSGQSNLINYRFGAVEPDIRGVSSRLRMRNMSFMLSSGQLGESRGSLLSGFDRTSGRVDRAQWTGVEARRSISLEAWNTSKGSTIDDRSGYRLAVDQIVAPDTIISANFAGSGGNRALLIGGRKASEFTRHDFGAYYFEPDIVWIDSRIGDDNAGLFYRFFTRAGTTTMGSSIELRRDGIAGSRARTDTSHATFSFSNRLNRVSTLSTVYNYRRVEQPLRTYDEHSLQGYYTLTHRRDAQSRFSARAQTHEDDSELDLTYGWQKNLRDDAVVELESQYRTRLSGARSNEWQLRSSYSKQFFNGHSLSLGLGYSLGASAREDNQGFNGYLNYDAPISPRLALSFQVEYSRDATDYENEDFADELFTGNVFDDEDLNRHRSFSALLRLEYRLGAQERQHVLGGRSSDGAGQVIGSVFADTNGDGVRQANEPGVAGVTVFLNSVHPVVTDARGEYRFPRVSPGEHFMFLDEGALPLPWALSGSEFTPFSVRLRQATELNIPLSNLQDEEPDQPENSDFASVDSSADAP